jgi:hypothetical protein
MQESQRAALLERALERVLEVWKEADESYLQRLLQVPFCSGGQQRALLAWLSGRDCDVPQLQRIGATASLSEELCPAALRTLAAVASVGAPIVMVFDQLENLVQVGGVDSRLLAYANLCSELVDTMRGMVLVHMALDTEWQRAIEPSFNLSQRSRLLMQRHALSLPNAKEREELLRLWIERVPHPDAAFPWPLSEGHLSRLLSTPGLTPRMLLIELQHALDGNVSVDTEAGPANGATESAANQASSEVPALGLEREWEQRLNGARARLDEAFEQRACADAARLVDGLLACGRFVPDVVLRPSGLKGEPVQLVAEVSGVERYIALLQQGSPKSLGSALTRLTALTAKRPVWALREKVHELPPTWKETRAKRHSLLATDNATWVDLDREDATRLLALDELMQSARSGDVTDSGGRPIAERVVCDWVQQTLAVQTWTVIGQLFGLASAEVETARGADDDRSDELGVSQSFPRAVQDLAETGQHPEFSDGTLAMLFRLRLASLDRLVREVTRIDSRATRTSVINALEARPERVRWFGRSIVAVKEPS